MKAQAQTTQTWQSLPKGFNPQPYPTTGRSGSVVVDRRR